MMPNNYTGDFNEDEDLLEEEDGGEELDELGFQVDEDDEDEDEEESDDDEDSEDEDDDDWDDSAHDDV
jgi:hypothetical protein